MFLMETDRIKVTFDVPDRVRRALNISASRQDCSVGEVIEKLAEVQLPEELEMADRAIAAGHKSKKGRKTQD